MPSVKTVFSLFLAALLGTAFQAFSFSGRNQSLKDIPDRTWVQVCSYTGATTENGGVSEVPWAFDADSRIFVRVGGCTGGYTNSTGFFDMGTETQTVPWTMDVSNPSDRPGGGCNRGLCYDPRSKCLFEMGGASSGPCYGTYGLWKGDMAARTWTRLDAESGQQGHVAVDTVNNRVIIWYWDSGHWLHVYIWNPENNTKTVCQPRPGAAVGEDTWDVNWWPAMEWGAAIGGTMEVGYLTGTSVWYTWLFSTTSRTWSDLNSTGLEGVGYGRAVLSYDPPAGVMLLLIAGQGLYEYDQAQNAWKKITSTPFPTGWSEMFDYDSEHNVHAFCGLTSSVGGSVWAFRYMNDNSGLEKRVSDFTPAAPGLKCSPNPFRSVTNITYGVTRASDIRLSVYDLQGRMLGLLINAQKQPGVYSLPWNVPPATQPGGVYILRLESGQEKMSSRLVLLK